LEWASTFSVCLIEGGVGALPFLNYPIIHILSCT
jgi:hypothetical protein